MMLLAYPGDQPYHLTALRVLNDFIGDWQAQLMQLREGKLNGENIVVWINQLQAKTNLVGELHKVINCDHFLQSMRGSRFCKDQFRPYELKRAIAVDAALALPVL